MKGNEKAKNLVGKTSKDQYLRLICVTLAFCAALSSLGQVAQDAHEVSSAAGGASLPLHDAWNLFKDDGEGFQVELPNDWVVIRPDMEKAGEAYRAKLQAAALPDWLVVSLLERAVEGHRVTAVHAVRSGNIVRSVASVSIAVKHLPTPFSSLYLAQMAAAGVGEAAKIRDPIPVKALGLHIGSGHTFSYLSRVKMPDGTEAEIHNTVIFFCQGSRVFIIECCCLAEEATSYGPLFGRLAQSLTLRPAAPGEADGGKWTPQSVLGAGITMELPAPAEYAAVFGHAVPPKATPFIGRVIGYDCAAGPLRFYVLMGFHRADSGPRILRDFLEGPGRAALLSLFPSALDNSESQGGQSSAETQRAVRQMGYEAIRWEMVGTHQGGKVALHCLVFATAETAYLVAFYHPEGDAEAAKAAERALASCKAEDESVEGLGQVAPFLRETAEESLLNGPWLARTVGTSGFHLNLPEPMVLSAPSRPPPPAGSGSSQPQFEIYSCNAKGIGLIIQTVSAKGVMGSAANLIMIGVQDATFTLEQMGCDPAKIKKTALDSNTIKIDGATLEQMPNLHMTTVVTAREGRACSVSVVMREGDTVADLIARKILKSLK